jgi:hypothetical protein
MGWTGIGWWIALGLGAAGTAVTYLWPAAREFGYVLLGIAIFSFAAAGVGAAKSGWPHIKALGIRLGTARTMLLFGIIGIWIFVSFTMGIAGWIVAHPTTPANSASSDDGPISWVYNLSMDRAGLNGINISALRFRGANISKKLVHLKEATITSLIDGTRLPLDIVASDSHGNFKNVPLDKVQLIPPGASIELLVKLGPPDPATPGYVLGVDADTLLAKWRQFSFEASDETRSYRMDFNENVMMTFSKEKSDRASL